MTALGAIINPAAAHGGAGALWERLCRAEPRLRAARLVQLPDRHAARDALARLLDSGIDTLFVLGGDGSIHLAANVMLEMGCGTDVALGFVPAGTGSDLSRAVALPREPLACVQRLLGAQPRPMDALEMETADGRRCFVLNIASAGISGVVDEAVNALVRPGRTAYLGATLKALARYRPARCRVRVDGEDWYEGEILVAAVANGTCFGRGMRIAPEARMDDGAADVVLVGPVPRWQLPFRLPRLYQGTHLDSPLVRWRRGKHIALEPIGPSPPFDVDGEVFAAAATSLTVRPGVLRILA